MKKKGPGSKKHVQGLKTNVTASKNNVLGLKKCCRVEKKVRVEKTVLGLKKYVALRSSL